MRELMDGAEICPACINDFLKTNGIQELGSELEDYPYCKSVLCENHKDRDFFIEHNNVNILINE